MNTNEGIRRSESSSGAIFRSSLDSLIVVDHEGRIVDFNPAAERMFGYRQEEVIGRPMAELIVPREGHRAAFQRQLETGESSILGKRIEFTGMRADGSELPIEMTIAHVDGSAPPMFTGHLRDISDRKRSEEALRESEERHRLMFAGNPQPMWVMDKETLRFLDVNDAAVRQYGYSREEFLRMTVKEIRPPSAIPHLMASLAKAMDQPDGEQRGHRHRRKDGSIFDVEVRWHDVPFGSRPARLVVVDDLSHRRLVDEAKDRLASVLEATTDFVAFADPDGRVTYVNDAGRAILGMGDGDLGSMSVRDLYPGWAHRLIADQGSPTAVKEGSWSGETALLHRDGHEVPVSQVIVAHRTSSGDVDFFSTTCRDISGQRAAARERDLLLQKERAARVELEAGKKRLELVARASQNLASSLDFEGTLARVANEVVPDFADLCSIQLIAEDGTREHLEVGHSDPTRVKTLGEWQADYPYDPHGAHGTARARRTRKPEFWPEVSESLLHEVARDAHELEYLRALEIRSAMTVPLLARGRCLGAITMLSSAADRRYSEADLATAQELADRCALAIENARLYRETQRAVQENEESLALLNALVATAPVGVALVDRDLRIIRANEQVAALHGKSPEELVGVGVQRLLPVKASKTERTIKKVLRTGEPALGIEFTAETPAEPGRQRHWLTSWYPVRAKGQIVGAGVVLVEITERKETEDALRRSEGRFRSIFATTGVGISTATLDGAFTEVNPAYCQMLGYDEAELLSMRWQDITHPDDLAVNETELAGLGRGRAWTGGFEKRLRRKDGTFITVLIDVCRFFGPDGAVIGQVAITQDLTERKQVEQALRGREASLQAIFSTTRVGVSLADLDGKLVQVNPAYCRILGYTEEEMVGMRWPDFTHPDDLIEPMEQVRRLMSGQLAEGGVEARLIRKDGTHVSVSLDVSLVMAEDGTPEYTACLVQDITERRLAQERLRRSEERLRLALEAGGMGTWEYDVTTKRETWDEALEAIFGLGPGEFPGTVEAFLELVHPEDRDRVKSLATSPAGPSEIEYRIVRPDGSVRTVLTRGNVVTDEKGNAIRDIGIGIDITERKESEQALARSEQRFRALTENSSDSIVLIGPDARVAYVSPHGYRMLGYTEEESIGSDAFGWLHPDDVPTAIRQFQEVIENPGRPVSAQLRVRRSDGEWRWIEGVARNMVADPSVEAVVINSRDITEPRQAMESLRESEERLRFALEAGQMGAWHHDFATNTLTWDDTMRSIFGVPPDTPIRTFEDYMRWVHPDDRERVLSHAGQVMEKLSAGDLEHRIVRPDGHERWIWGGMRHIRDDGGAIVGIAGIVADITERKQTERELEARVLQQAALAELLQTALSESNRSALMDEATAVVAKTLGVEFAKVLELVPERHVLRLSSGVGWREGAVGTVEVPIVPGTQAGQSFLAREPVVVEDLTTEAGLTGADFLREYGIVSGASIPIVGPDGALGVLGVHSRSARAYSRDDIHFLRSVAAVLADGLERIRSEEELRRTLTILRATDEERRKLLSRLVRVQEEERERIASDIHDDSIQVMTALSLRLQMLKDELTDPQQLARLAELEVVLEKTIGRLRHLLFELRPPALDREGLTPALRDYLQTMSEEDGAGYSIENHLLQEPETEARVIVYRIAQEALINVRKHARATNVAVSLDEREGGVFVTIQDDGRGFPSDVTRESLPGHLGLTAMRERAEMAGGWLKISSQPGNGTNVQFWIPAEKVRA